MKWLALVSIHAAVSVLPAMENWEGADTLPLQAGSPPPVARESFNLERVSYLTSIVGGPENV